MAAKAWGDAQWADVVGLGTFGVYGLDVCSRTRPNGLVFYGRAVLVAAHDFECVGWHDGPFT